MNEKTQELMMYGAVAALGYALYRQFGGSLQVGTKTAAASGLPSAGKGPQTAWNGTEYDTANPGAFISLKDLFGGVIHDIYSGDKSGETPATIYEIQNSVLTDYYGTRTTDRPGEFMRPEGAYW